MTRKSILCIFLCLVFIGFSGVLVFRFSIASQTQASTLWNLQKLEEIAESGDVEAQLRLIDFYQQNINSRDHYKEKLEYWRKKAEAKKSSEEYSLAAKKLSDERQNYFKEREHLQKEMQDRMLKLKEKYEKLPPEAQKNEAMMWHDGLNAVFNTQSIYSWKQPFSLRYRLTINIQTPEGIKTGSTVQEVFYPPADTENIYNPYNQGIPRGEAAYIDLGERGVIFAIMPDPPNAKNKFFGLIQTVFPTVPTVYDQSRYQEILQHYNDLGGVKDEVPPELYPMFVYFKDINDLKTFELVYKRKEGSRRDMREVEVDRLEEIFGKGVKIKNMILEMTDDPLEWKLDDKLKWIEVTEEGEITRLLKEEYNRKITSGEIRTNFITNGIAYYIFRQWKEEPLQKIESDKKHKQEIKDKLSKYKAYDSIDEVPVFFRKHLRDIMGHLHHTMTFDKFIERINKDEQPLTDEMLDAALRAFVTVDTNKDGVISYNEHEARSKKRR